MEVTKEVFEIKRRSTLHVHKRSSTLLPNGCDLLPNGEQSCVCVSGGGSQPASSTALLCPAAALMDEHLWP